MVADVDEAMRRGGLLGTWEFGVSVPADIRHVAGLSDMWIEHIGVVDERKRCRCSGQLPLDRIMRITPSIQAFADVLAQLSMQCHLEMTAEDLVCDACREHCHLDHRNVGSYKFPLVGSK